MCFVEVDMCFRELVHSIAGAPVAGYMPGCDGQKNIALVVDSNVVEGHMGCMDNLSGGFWVGCSRVEGCWACTKY